MITCVSKNGLPTRSLSSTPVHRCKQLSADTRNCATSALNKRNIGSSDLNVSSICFGTMLFGEATPEQLAFQLLDRAAERGVNFFDTAEMYPVPQKAETQGASEVILGKWLGKQARTDFVVATKIAGPGGMDWLRGGPLSLDAANITAAIDGSLQRLRTDYIDLIQLHWPDRYVPMFGDVDYNPSMLYSSVPLEEQLEAVHQAVQAGKVRYLGLSNETPYGLMRFCQLGSSSPSFPPVVSLQNAYSLLCRTFDAAMAECCHQEGVGMLAYSPLAMGLLTGKYLDPGGGPPQASLLRLTGYRECFRLNKYKARYAEAEARYGPKPNVRDAVCAYVRLAEQHQLTPVELAIRFVASHPLVASTVVGASCMEQLDEVLAAGETPWLDSTVRHAVNAVHQRYPNPCP